MPSDNDNLKKNLQTFVNQMNTFFAESKNSDVATQLLVSVRQKRNIDFQKEVVADSAWIHGYLDASHPLIKASYAERVLSNAIPELKDDVNEYKKLVKSDDKLCESLIVELDMLASSIKGAADHKSSFKK